MSPLAVRVARRAAGTGLAAAGLFVVVYLLALWTRPGQRFEDGVLRAADRLSASTDGQLADRLLRHITEGTIAAAIVVVVAIGLLRRRRDLAVVGAGLIVACLVATEVLQRTIMRPVLLSSGYRREDQSFPSGHAAIAMSVMCALVLVVPYRYRALTVLVTAGWSVTLSVATVTADWHRPSDTLGSDLLVLLFTCAALATLAWRGAVRPAAPHTARARLGNGLVVAVFAALAVTAAVIAAVAVTALLADVAGLGSQSALAAGRAIAVTGSAAVTLVLLALLRGIDLVAPTADNPPTAGDGRLLRRASDVAR